MSTRADFEEAVFRKYFMSHIGPGLDGSKLKNCEDMATFCRRDPDNPEHYQREDVSAMWYGWTLRESMK